MYIDEVLGSQNAFGKFYAYCRTKGDAATRRLEFLQMVRVLNPKLGRHARDFFPACLRTDDERATHLYSAVDFRDLSGETLKTIQYTASLAQLGVHSFDIAYIEKLRITINYDWESFVNTSEGESIGASRYGSVAERDQHRAIRETAERDHKAASGAVRVYPDPGTPSRRKIEAEAVRQAVSKELEGLNLDPFMAELMLRQRTDQRLKELAESRQPRIDKDQDPPLGPKPPLFRPSSRSVLPMPIAAPAPAIVLPAAMPAHGGHHRRAQVVFATPHQIPVAAASASSASSAASAQGRAEIADALRRQGKCVPASLSAAPLSAAAARKRPIHFRIVDAKP